MTGDKKTILVIEDALTEQQALKRVLEGRGFHVICAGDGETGVEKAAQEKPNLVLIDTMLPGINGFEACKRIKAIPGLITKIIINTGKIDAVDELTAKRSGSDAYCVKTTDFSRLMERIQALMG